MRRLVAVRIGMAASSRVLLSCLAFSSVVAISLPALGYVWLPNSDKTKTYSITDNYGTWQQSQNEATSVGGNLVTIGSIAENNDLSFRFKGVFVGGDSSNPWGSYVWTGLNKLSGNWGWVSGQPMTYPPPLPWWNGGPFSPPGGGDGSEYGYLHTDTHPSPRTWYNGAHTGVTWGIIETTVPEPSTLALLGIGAIGLLAYAWRRWRRAG